MDAPIPLALVQAGLDLTEPRVHPSGRSISWVQRGRGPATIMAAPLRATADAGDRRLRVGAARPVSFGPAPAPGRGTGGGCYAWIPDGSLVYASVDGRLHHLTASEVSPLTSDERIARAPAVGTRPDGSVVVAVVLDEAEVVLVDVADGSVRRLDDGGHEFCFDPAVAPDGRAVSWTGWNPPDMPWDGAVRIDADLATGELTVAAAGVEGGECGGAVQQPRFLPDGRGIQIDDAGGWRNVTVEGRPLVAEPVEHGGPTWGMGERSYAASHDGSLVAFTRNEHGYGSLELLDTRSGVIRTLGRGVHGQLGWLEVPAEDPETESVAGVVALRSGARTPTEVVVYPVGGGDDGSSARVTVVVSAPDAWSAWELPEPELVEATAPDGTTLHARRYVAGSGRMLVWVHGGPTDQWRVDWRPRIPYWWSRGWDVLVVDPRGTTGHGRAYEQALHGGWGRVDVDDTAALVRHAHAVRWADASSTIAIGGSSGGLTVLGLLADHPDLVAGGVTSYPVSDLHALAQATHRFEAHYTDTLVAPLDGAPAAEARFRELSPVHRAHRIAAPLLVFHGSDDPVVPLSQSEALAEAVRRVGGEIELVVYEGEGHGFRDPGHVRDEYERTEAFLERVVG